LNHLRFVLTAGTDLKSVLLNLASALLILLPVACYLYAQHTKIFLALVGVIFVLAYVAQPVGWKRPHPYSDDPNNRPKKR